MHEVVMVSIGSLVRTESPRSRGEDTAHVQRLAEAEWPLPPILVHKPSLRVIDGCHRVSAALHRGLDEIPAVFVEGSDEAAFVIAVRENVSHGLPLSLADRREAAARILRSHPQWSDRAIGVSTGLSAKTVRSLRSATADDPHLHDRVGQDGRIRPLNADAGRKLAAELIAKHPEASLRQIAKAAGISASTVRDVRARVGRGESALPSERPKAEPQATRGRTSTSPATRSKSPSVPEASGAVAAANIDAVLSTLSKDPALRMSGSGRELLRWLHAHSVNGEDSQMITDSVPEHCLDHLVELARRCSANWAAIAGDWAQRSQLGTIGPVEN